MDENHEATGYIVVGENKAVVIDTMMGYNDLRAILSDVTDKEVMVINTHGHPDHIYGNVYFDKAYINPKDIPLAMQFAKEPRFVEACEKYGFKMPPFDTIGGGDVIDLGKRTLEVYDLPGHTQGGIILLLKEDRILFTGDSINHHLWLMVPGALPLPEFLDNLDKVMFLEDKADLILHGHAREFDDIALMRSLRQGVIDIIEGRTEDDPEYKWFDGVDRQHHFLLPEGKHFQQHDSVICYKR